MNEGSARGFCLIEVKDRWQDMLCLSVRSTFCELYIMRYCTHALTTCCMLRKASQDCNAFITSRYGMKCIEMKICELVRCSLPVRRFGLMICCACCEWMRLISQSCLPLSRQCGTCCRCCLLVLTHLCD